MKHPNNRSERRHNGIVWRNRQRSKMLLWNTYRYNQLIQKTIECGGAVNRLPLTEEGACATMKSSVGKKFVSAGKVWTLKPGESLYTCPSCKKTLKRLNEKAWMYSFCESTGKTTRLQRVVKQTSKRR